MPHDCGLRNARCRMGRTNKEPSVAGPRCPRDSRRPARVGAARLDASWCSRLRFRGWPFDLILDAPRMVALPLAIVGGSPGPMQESRRMTSAEGECDAKAQPAATPFHGPRED